MEKNKNIEPEQSPENIRGGEHSEIPPSSGEIISSQENILPETEGAASEQPQTTNPKLPTKEMEVHHHGHVHEKKKWKEYVFQFLMLFLAVFCGFLAEYKLEQTIEHHKEKEYIESMMEDLQNDTTKLSKLNLSLVKIQNSIDTILMYYDDMPKGANPSLFRNIQAIYGFPIFIYSDRTIQQLKSSGGMRLIKNKKAASGIMDYDAYVRNYENNGLYVQVYWENLTFQRINIIDQQALDNDLKTTGEINTDKSYLLVNDPVILRKLKSFIYELKIYHSSTIQDNIELKEKAMMLIQILKKEYHLK